MNRLLLIVGAVLCMPLFTAPIQGLPGIRVEVKVAVSLIDGVNTGRDQEPCPVDRPCGGIPRFAEYGNIRARDERAVLDHLARQLRMNPDEIVYIVVYAGQVSCVDEARLRALRIKNYLVKKYGIADNRIVWKDGGFKVDLSTELWLLPRTSLLPDASPQLDRANKILGKCKLRAFSRR